MRKLFPLPSYSLLKIAYKNKGISGRGLLHLPPFLVKTILFEPLRWVELVTKHQRINQHSITDPPVFILGYYRSGTTYLQQLFMQDERFGYTSAFQMLFPEIMLSCEKWLSPVLEQVSRLLRIQNPIHRIPFSFNSPGEDDVAMTAALFETGAQWGQFFPASMHHYFKRFVLFDEGPGQLANWKEDYHLLLKKISLANHQKRLVLKSPPHTARIKVLLSLFPEARFIFIHRNPYDVFASNQKLWKVVEQQYMLGRPCNSDYSEIILNCYADSMQRYLEDKTLLQAGHLVEIRYDDFIAEPLNTMKKIYASLHLPNIQYCEPDMSSFIEKQKAYPTQKHQLSLKEINNISVRWKRFIEHWDYPLL